ncbi:hypothetical protein NE237_010285 [Protea cynaroides]|uniref:Uncharacterized protein n=1 Tax=Protea cynaroides TaxID=273540 RepID=A0A9Q0KZI4_9MAGN|nr:hypothetical protein NE237_010285 [Protea cynaroides]
MGSSGGGRRGDHRALLTTIKITNQPFLCSYFQVPTIQHNKSFFFGRYMGSSSAIIGDLELEFPLPRSMSVPTSPSTVDPRATADHYQHQNTQGGVEDPPQSKEEVL